jgi:hypothetical protein
MGIEMGRELNGKKCVEIVIENYGMGNIHGRCLWEYIWE